MFDLFPHTEIESCIAFPLNWPDSGGWPIGVLVLASTLPRDGLREIIKDKSQQSLLLLFDEILNIWANYQPRVFPA